MSFRHPSLSKQCDDSPAVDDLDLLDWWATVLRDHCLMQRDPPAGVVLARGVALHAGKIMDEPCAMDCSSDGRCVALGTHSGEVVVFRFISDPDGWVRESVESVDAVPYADLPVTCLPGSSTNASTGQALESIQTLNFIGPDLLLVGSEGLGFRLYRHQGQAWDRVAPAPGHQSVIEDATVTEPVARAWLRGPRRGLRLIPHGMVLGARRPVLLAGTPSGWYRVVFAAQDDAGCCTLTEEWVSPQHVWNQTPSDSAHPVDDTGPVDVTWVDTGDVVQAFFLTEGGTLRRWGGTFGSTTSWEPLDAPIVRELHRPSSNRESSALAHAGRALAILRDEHVTIVDGDRPGSGSLQWASVPGGRALAAFSTRPHAKAPEQVHILVASRAHGLAWTSWRPRDGGWTFDEPVERSTAGTGSTEILCLAVGGSSGENGGPSSYLATVGRDYQVNITSFLNRAQVNERILELLAIVPRNPALEASAGITDLRVLVAMCRQFDVSLRWALVRDTTDPGSFEQEFAAAGLEKAEDTAMGVDELPPWRLALTEIDLRWITRALADLLIASASRVPEDTTNAPGSAPPAIPAPTETAQKIVEAFQLRSLRLFRRLTELQPSSPELAVWVASRLAAAAEHAARRRPALGLLLQSAELLRRWIVHGGSYADKRDRLNDLYAWSQRGGRTLDALAYVARLLQQELDRQWRSDLPTPEPNPAILALCVDHKARFSIHAHHDGRITACDREGRLLPFAPARGLRPVPWTHIVEGALEASDNVGFRRHHYRGRYTRALALIALESHPHRSILIFSWKGDEPGTRDGSFARLHVLTLDHATARLDIIDYQAFSLRLVGSQRKMETHEVYSLTVLGERLGQNVSPRPGRTRIDEREIAVAVGTRGAGRTDDHATAFSCPLLELRVEVKRGAATGGQVLRGPPCELQEERSVGFRDEVHYNPTWCVTVSDDGWVWTGHHDGVIRRFRWTWKEGIKNPDETPQIELKVHASISALATLTTDKTLLAYGTTSGVVGACVVDFACQRDDREITYLIHDRVGSWVRHVTFYEDSISIQGNIASQHCLLAAEEGGSLAVYDVAQGGSRRPYNRTWPLLGRRWPTGTRLDRIRVPEAGAGGQLRNAVLIYNLEEGTNGDMLSERIAPPVVFLADSAGQVARWALTAPKKTHRRSHLWKSAMRLPIEALDAAARTREQSLPLADGVGDLGALGTEWALRWLRVYPTSELSLFRHALYRDLDRLFRPAEVLIRYRLNPENPEEEPSIDEIEAALEHAQTHLEPFLEETYRHKVAEWAGAKVIWERVARVANLIGALIFLDKEDSDKWISRYRRLSEEVDGICARWVGQDSAVESRVLMHSFAQLFDWCDVLLLSVPLPGTVAQTALREHLFRQVIQTRLFNRSELVTTEALRAINLAIIRAVDRVHVRRALLALPPPSMGESRRGWKSLVIMVGEVAVRSRDHLVASDPLFTEVARFFAGCLLLMPEHSLAVGMILSESGLVGPSGRRNAHDVVEQVLGQARLMKHQMKDEFDASPLQAWDDAIDRLDCYLRGTFDAIKGGEKQGRAVPWTQEQGLRPHYNDADIEYERQLVEDAMLALWPLDPAPGADDEVMFINTALFQEDFECRYFSHSREILLQLFKYRYRVRHALHLVPIPEAISRQHFPRRDRSKQDDCEALLLDARRYLDERQAKGALFEPQASHFRGVVGEWGRAIILQGSKTIQKLDLLARFNRHRYQAGASDLTAEVVRLAAQFVPDAWERELRDVRGVLQLRARLRDALKPRPLFYSLYNRALDFVDDANFAAALLHVIRNDITKPKRGPVVGESTKWRVFKGLAERLAIEQDLTPSIASPPALISDPNLPAPEFIWSAVLREAFTNVKHHARYPKGKKPTKAVVHLCIRRDEPSAKWGLLICGKDAQFRLSVEEGKTPREKERELNSDEEKPAAKHGFGFRMLKMICKHYGIDAELRSIFADDLARWLATTSEIHSRPAAPLSLVLKWQELP